MRNAFIIFSIIVIGFVLRIYFISNNDILFYYDQARDATIARSIIEKGDIKIQGPSASGTNNTLYHGVLYFYLISPFYYLFRGNPFPVTFILGLLNALTIIPLYLLTEKMTGSRPAAVASSLLFAVSVHSVHAGIWLSNPTLVPLLMMLFYYFLWTSVFEKRYDSLPWMFLFLGLSSQSFVYTAYLWLSVLGGLIIVYRFRSENGLPFKQVGLGLVVYILSIATMIISELLLLKNGLLNTTVVDGITQKGMSWWEKMEVIISAYYKGVTIPVFPEHWPVALLIILTAMAWFLLKATRPASQLMLLWIASPLLLEIAVPRNDKHTLLGLSLIIYIILGFGLAHLYTTFMGKVLVILFAGIFLWLNMHYFFYSKHEAISLFVIPRGATLRDQLALIDYTYTRVNKDRFTISTYTNPYDINTTWAYLYNWHGNSTYGYLPEFYGSSQKERVASDLLNQTEKYGDKHFTIYEPFEGLPDGFDREFATIQTLQVRPVSDTHNFRKLRLEERFK